MFGYSSNGAILGIPIGYGVTGGPWWAKFAVAAFAMLAVVLRIIFPQDSRDKLAWWRDLTKRKQ
jgi:hypothetical protein